MVKKNRAINKTEVALGVGAGLLAAGAAGYYFYASKRAKKHRKVAVFWAKNLKEDVQKEIKKLKSLDQATITNAIDKAVKTYKGVRVVRREDLMRAIRELKENWQELERESRRTVSAGKSTGRKMARAAKRIAKKSI